MPATVSRITIYPFKSLDGYASGLLQTGSGSYVRNDRRYALVDAAGKMVNGKATPLVHQLRLNYLADAMYRCTSVTLNRSIVADMNAPRAPFNAFLSEHFGRPVELREDENGNFQDVPQEAAITLVSTATLEQVAQWMNINDLDEVRRRFRATVEVSGVPAFWEDALFGAPGDVVPFRIGAVDLECVGPRERCVVPTRNSITGAVDAGFAKELARQRWEHRPKDSQLPAWRHGYFIGVDCRIPPASWNRCIYLGDTFQH